MGDRKVISLVTPTYNEEDNVLPCYETLRDIFQKDLPDYDCEHVFCDNASTDGTVERLRELASRDRRVKVILNARNFGALRSLYNGVMATSGDAVLLFVPADLQDPPELIPEFVKRWEEGYEVINGIRKKRQESRIMSAIRKAYYRLVSRLADVHLPPDVGEFQLVDRKVVETLRKFDDYYPYVRGMVASCGFRATGIEYVWKKRERGKSKARWYGMIDIGLNGIISFTKVPLRLCMFAGFVISGLSIAYALVSLLIVVLQSIFLAKPIAAPGIPTLIVAVFLLSGVQLFFLGVLGEYICAIHSQVRKRPLVIERERINF